MNAQLLSEYRLLVIIPVYNHHQKIAQLLNAINAQGFPCLVLDDGSDTATQQTLREVVAKKNLDLTTTMNVLQRYPCNRGKGAVVCDGIRYAQQQGYTHALQIDADGQHNLADLPAFVAASRQQPDAIINGSRPYDTMPPARRLGRKITDIWVRINTLSSTIHDSMCGYRLYPVHSTFTLLETHTIGQRMDFDTEVLVRSYWAGCEIVHINTSVHYDENIISHFDLWADNFRISRMHARLFFGMLLRFQELLARNKKRCSLK